MFPQKLIELRKKRRITQADMAKILGVARTTYSSYEQGRRSPDDETQKKIADYFGVTLDYLHGRNNDKKVNLNSNQITVASHIDDDVTSEEMEDILNYIEFRKQQRLKRTDRNE